MHGNYKIIHNDIKCDNIVVTSEPTHLKAVVVDFGKVCRVAEGKHYELSEAEKSQYKQVLMFYHLKTRRCVNTVLM